MIGRIFFNPIFQGDGNSGGSLSSLNSGTDDADLEFEYLHNFGVRNVSRRLLLHNLLANTLQLVEINLPISVCINVVKCIVYIS